MEFTRGYNRFEKESKIRFTWRTSQRQIDFLNLLALQNRCSTSKILYVIVENFIKQNEENERK